MPVYPNYQVVAPLASQITHPGFPLQLVPIGLPNYGGIVINPFDAVDQGLTEPEELFVSIVKPPAQFENAWTTKLEPGQQFLVPRNTHVWVDALSPGHSFTAYFYSSSIAVRGSATPVPGTFPPTGPTGLTKVIASYLYQQYTDDDDLQAFVDSENSLQQNYVDTFNALNLPIYTNALIKDALLDWVAEGIYGYKRPWIYTQKPRVFGPLNTWGPGGSPVNHKTGAEVSPARVAWNGFVPINSIVKSQPQGFVIADDDFYKRCLTWHYHKGDGRYTNIRWLKRRIMRFLIGVNGSSPPVDQTNDISITFGAHYNCTVRFVQIIRTVVGGMLPNRFGPNGTLGGVNPGGASRFPQKIGIARCNWIFTTAVNLPPPSAYVNQFAEALNCGVLELPFQFTFNVVIG